MLAPDPIVCSIRDFYRVSVPAFGAVTANQPGKVGPVNYHFATRREVRGLICIPALGTPEALASLSLSILDQDDNPIFTDYRGVAPNGFLHSHAQPLEALQGRMWKAFPLMRVVQAYDRWRISLLNFDTGAVAVASVAILTQRLDA